MAVTKHAGDESPAATESAFRGYPLGVWPAVISSFCSASPEPRHSECTLPGCTCPCHLLARKKERP